MADGSGQHEDIELAAFDAQRSVAKDGRMEFRWMDSAKKVDAFFASSEPRLAIQVPEAGVDFVTSIKPPQGDPQQEPFIDIEGTPYAYRVRGRQDNLQLQDGRVLSV